MPKYEIFAGIWNLHSHGIYEYDNIHEAEKDAYEKAIEEYHSYEGSHGILDYDECCEDARESWDCEDWTEEDFENFYNETIQSTIQYAVEEVLE